MFYQSHEENFTQPNILKEMINSVLLFTISRINALHSTLMTSTDDIERVETLANISLCQIAVSLCQIAMSEEDSKPLTQAKQVLRLIS